MPFAVVYHPDVVERDIPALNGDLKARIRKAVEARLTRAPENYGKPLRGSLTPLWRLRVGDYRVVYLIEPPLVRVVLIAHRKDAYEHGLAAARRDGLL